MLEKSKKLDVEIDASMKSPTLRARRTTRRRRWTSRLPCLRDSPRTFDRRFAPKTSNLPQASPRTSETLDRASSAPRLATAFAPF